MIKKITEIARLCGEQIERKDERIATCVLTVKARVPYSPHEHAIRLLYSESIVSGSGMYNRSAWQNALGNLGTNITTSLDDGDIDFRLHTIDISLTV
jgi:predicted component of type VI protein secretion system